MTKFIQSKLDDLDMHNKAIAEEKEEDGEETEKAMFNDESEIKNSHFEPKARQKAAEVTDFESCNSTDAAYRNFRKKLTRYFQNFFKSQSTDSELPQFREISEDDEVSAASFVYLL